MKSKRIVSLMLSILTAISMMIPCVATRASAAVSYTDVSEYVATTINLNVRKGPSTSYEKIATTEKGSQVLRIGIGDDGWSKVIYKGAVSYMDSTYLKTATYDASKDVSNASIEGLTVTRVNESVAITGTVNIRSGPSTSYKKIGEFKEGDAAIRIGIYNNGWSQLIYENKVCYVSSRYMSTIKYLDGVFFEAEAQTAPPSRGIYYATTNLNVRSGPSANERLLGLLKENEKVISLGTTSNGWHKINFGGQTAYVNGNYLSKTCGGSVDTTSYPLTYHDDTCAITIYKQWYENAYVYAAHITFTDYDRLWAECAKGKYNSGYETTSAAARRVGAILAINGDYAVPANGASAYAIARNGVVCNDKKTYSEGAYNSNTGVLLYGQSKGINGQQLGDLVNAGTVTDTFQFAPVCLLNGEIKGDPDSTNRAQRTFIGTNGEAGDIWLCVSDGRYNDGKSAGLNAYQCGAYLKSKGCTLCIPLDGGGSSAMYFNGQVLNAAKNGQRSVVDFLVFK